MTLQGQPRSACWSWRTTPTVSEVVIRYLERAGYEVSSVADGPSALAAAHDAPPDLVVLDLMLPGMHGLEVFRALRDSRPCASSC
jgi:DNA-binding response OmpR family regulator